AAYLAHPAARGAQRGGQLFRADDDHRHHDDDEQFLGADIKHGSRQPVWAQLEWLGLSACGLAADSLAGASAVDGAGWFSIRGGGAELCSSCSASVMPFLKLLMPLPKSPIISEILPRPKRTR